MSAHPEQVAQLEALVAKHKALVKELMGILETLSRGTAHDVLTGPCARCLDAGVVYYSGANEPCTCPKGAEFRQAQIAQEAKRRARELAAGQTARHLSHGETHAKGEAGRDKQWRDE